jgi:hypothetical protein
MGQTQGAPGAADRAAAATRCACVALKISATKIAHKATNATIAAAFSRYRRIAQHAPVQSARIARIIPDIAAPISPDGAGIDE